MAQKHNLDQMQNPYPPNYGTSDGPSAPLSVIDAQQTSAPTVAQMAPCKKELDPNDTYALPPHVEIAFDDTFKESETARGFEFMKDVNRSIYIYTHFAVYASLSLIIAPLLSFVWGIVFAISHLALIWVIQPAIKNVFIWIRVSSLLVSASVRMCFDPCFRSVSLVFSSIKGRFQLDDSEVTLNLKTSQVQHV